MKNSRLIEILTALDAEEIKKFRDFIRSPYFNKSESLVSFIEQVLKSWPDFGEKQIEKERIYRHLYPGKKYVDATINNFMKNAVALAERFLGQENYNSKPVKTKLDILQAMRLKQVESGFLKYERVVKEELENALRGEEYYYDWYRYWFELDYFYCEIREQSTTYNYLYLKTDFFDNHLMVVKLKLASDLLNRQNIFKSDTKQKFIGFIVDFLKDNKGKNSIDIEIYYSIFLCLVQPEEEQHFTNLLSLIEKNEYLFSKIELKEFYTYAQNYCTKKLNQGHYMYTEKLFGIYKKMIANEVLLEDGVLRYIYFKNIITIAIRLKEFAWVENFIAVYKLKINSVFHEVFYFYSLAELYFYKGDIKGSHKMLIDSNKQKVKLSGYEFEDIFYELDSKSLLLKIYYNIQDDVSLNALSVSYEAFIKRNKYLSERQKESYLNLNKFIQRMERFRRNLVNPHFNKDLSRLKHDLSLTTNLINKPWLEEQIAILEQQYSLKP